MSGPRWLPICRAVHGLVGIDECYQLLRHRLARVTLQADDDGSLSAGYSEGLRTARTVVGKGVVRNPRDYVERGWRCHGHVQGATRSHGQAGSANWAVIGLGEDSVENVRERCTGEDHR